MEFSKISLWVYVVNWFYFQNIWNEFVLLDQITTTYRYLYDQKHS